MNNIMFIHRRLTGVRASLRATTSCLLTITPRSVQTLFFDHIGCVFLLRQTALERSAPVPCRSSTIYVRAIHSAFFNKKHLKNVGPILHCEPPHALILHCHSPGVATVARHHCRTPSAHRCPRQQRQRVTEGIAMAPWNGPNKKLTRRDRSDCSDFRRRFQLDNQSSRRLLTRTRPS